MSLKLDCHLLTLAFLVNEIGQDHVRELNPEYLNPSSVSYTFTKKGEKNLK